MSQRTALLDLKGLAIDAYHSMPDPLGEPCVDSRNNPSVINRPIQGLEVFLTKYYEPVLDICKSPANMVAVLDSDKSFRKAIYSAYKNKEDTRDSRLITAEKESYMLILHFLKHMGVRIVYHDRLEADDVIAYLTERLPGYKTVHTRNKALVRLSSPTCFIFYDRERLDKFTDKGAEVPLPLVSLYKSIIGNSSAGLPGCKGVGPKGWVQLLSTFKEEGLLQVDQALREGNKIRLLAAARESGDAVLGKCMSDFSHWTMMYKVSALSPELVTKLIWIKRVPMFQKILDRVPASLVEKYKEDCYTATLVTNSNLQAFRAKVKELLPETPFVAWDYETTNKCPSEDLQAVSTSGKDFVDMLRSTITGCSFALGRNMNHVFYLSVDHAKTANVVQGDVLWMLKEIEKSGKAAPAHNKMFEGTVSKAQLKYDLPCWEDTKLYAHHLDENSPVKLKYLSKHYLAYDQTTYAEVLERAGAQRMDQLTGEQVLSYGADDSLVTAHLFQLFRTMTDIRGVTDFISKAECPSAGPLVSAHISGIKANMRTLQELASKDQALLDTAIPALRAVLKEHCTEPNFEGVERVLEDDTPYIYAKVYAKNKEASSSTLHALRKVARTKKQLALKNLCFYEDVCVRRKPVEFIPTASKLTAVCEALDLPPITKVTRAFLEDWLYQLAEVGGEFAVRLAKAEKELKKRQGEGYVALKDFCERILLEKSPEETLGTELNLDSPPQVQSLLYLLLDLPIRHRTMPTPGSLRDTLRLPGAPSTDEDAIRIALAEDCDGDNSWKREALELLLQIKSANTRFSNYWTKYPLWVSGSVDERMHPGFSSCGTVTRRPTGSNPNMLQVEKGGVRTLFEASSKDTVIVSIDWAGQELRILADKTRDPGLLSAFLGEKKKDLHVLTASEFATELLPLFPGVSIDDLVLDSDGKVDYSWFEDRRNGEDPVGKFLTKARMFGKTGNFSTVYEAAPSTVSVKLGIPLSLAESISGGILKAYPNLLTWRRDVAIFARQHGYVETAYGSRRHCGDALRTGTNSQIRRWERQLGNFLIQGTAADFLKTVLAKLHRERTLQEYSSKLLAVIYDEMLLEIPKKVLYEAITAVSTAMEIPMKDCIVPMEADCSVGNTWGEQIEVGRMPSRETLDKALKTLEER